MRGWSFLWRNRGSWIRHFTTAIRWRSAGGIYNCQITLSKILPRGPVGSMFSEHWKSISSQYSRNQKRTTGQIAGLELQSSFIFKSQSAFKGSSDAQPLGLNSTVDPSWCLHLKQKSLGSARSRLVALIAFGGIKV